ncbi:protein farnesyltransferase subunit beta-like [Penaeus japonicus]|uniref:protein farnesyltransferase subunit beta-like n=1 Tax=Penaeus japonicus TaxID=27405 RepID=UPI001C713129|nr:protein farnesyltransferase subunit beta-like [Penaeus japonicus]
MAAVMLRCLQSDINEERYSDKGVPTVTSDEQIKVEKNIAAIFNYFRNTIEVDSKEPLLHRERHIAYLKKGLKNLPEGFQCLDASRPWLVYWAVHALELLETKLNEQEAENIINFLKRCQNPAGGFGGGPSQYSHLAPTYAAVNALAIVGTKEAYDVINREKLQEFLWQMRTDEGAFRMHEGGEVDIRGVIHAEVSVARLANIAWNNSSTEPLTGSCALLGDLCLSYMTSEEIWSLVSFWDAYKINHCKPVVPRPLSYLVFGICRRRMIGETLFEIKIYMPEILCIL